VRILPRFDVLVENYRPDVMERFGLSAEKLTEQFPRLVYCGISGFGPDGPYRLRPGFDQIAQGMSGFMSLTGTEEMGPTRAGIAIGDVLAGIFAAHGIQLALLERARSGRGQIVHTSLLESMIAVLAWGAGMYFESGRAPGPAGQHHPLTAPYGRYAARDGYLNIAAAGDAQWHKLVAALERPEWLDDTRFSGVLERRANRGRAHARDRGGAARARRRGLGDADQRAAVPCGPVLDVAQVFADPAGARARDARRAAAPRGRHVQDHGPAREALAHARRDRAPAAAPRRAHRRGAARVRDQRREIAALRAAKAL
jgi:formyl-CoA transferase